MLTLKWAKKPDGNYYRLADTAFAQVKTVGVYHIWCVGNQSKFNIRSGQGIVGVRLTAHKSDPLIMRHSVSGVLFTTWAEVPGQYLDHVERYLADRYGPIEGDRYPDVAPLRVNLPGD